MKQQSPARSTNYIFVFDEDRSVSYAVQSAPTPDMTLGEAIYGAQPKDLFIPSNKIDSSPIIVQFLLDENLTQWLDMYKWMLQVKNSTKMYTIEHAKTCELTALDNQNQPLYSFIYQDCFPINISSIEYTSQGESLPLSFDVTLRYNMFKIRSKDGTEIEESYKG
jgi:hypothetical protein